MSCTRFRVNPYSILAWISRNIVLKTGVISESQVIAMRLEPTTTLFVNKHSNICPNWPNNRSEFWVLICTVHLAICTCHVTYPIQSESALYISLNVKELVTQKRRNVWSLSDCNRTQTYNHLVRKGSPNHLAKLTKWLNWIVSTYLYGAFHLMFLSCHVRVSESIHTLYLCQCQGNPYSKQVRYLKFKWLQRESNGQPLSL